MSEEQSAFVEEINHEVALKKAFGSFKRNPTKANAQELGKAMVAYAKDYAKQY